MTGQKGTL
jgi:hypothetical protein